MAAIGPVDVARGKLVDRVTVLRLQLDRARRMGDADLHAQVRKELEQAEDSLAEHDLREGPPKT